MEQPEEAYLLYIMPTIVDFPHQLFLMCEHLSMLIIIVGQSCALVGKMDLLGKVSSNRTGYGPITTMPFDKTLLFGKRNVSKRLVAMQRISVDGTARYKMVTAAISMPQC